MGVGEGQERFRRRSGGAARARAEGGEEGAENGRHGRFVVRGEEGRVAGARATLWRVVSVGRTASDDGVEEGDEG